MLKVALTGGIASGKSAAAAVFRELGVPVIDTDRIARELVKRGEPGLDALVKTFGESILDKNGDLDRKQMRERIFSDDAFRQAVNTVLHPMILARVEREVAALASPYVVIEIPLLAETGLAGTFDRVLVIDADDEIRIARIRQRDGGTTEQARAALDAQASREMRNAMATDLIMNNGPIEALEAAVRKLHETWLAASKRFASTPRRPSE